jgi:hypothetical protein
VRTFALVSITLATLSISTIGARADRSVVCELRRQRRDQLRFLFLSTMHGRDFGERRILLPEWILRGRKGFAKALSAIIRNVRLPHATLARSSVCRAEVIVHCMLRTEMSPAFIARRSRTWPRGTVGRAICFTLAYQVLSQAAALLQIAIPNAWIEHTQAAIPPCSRHTLLMRGEAAVEIVDPRIPSAPRCHPAPCMCGVAFPSDSHEYAQHSSLKQV